MASPHPAVISPDVLTDWLGRVSFWRVSWISDRKSKQRSGRASGRTSEPAIVVTECVHVLLGGLGVPLDVAFSYGCGQHAPYYDVGDNSLCVLTFSARMMIECGNADRGSR